MDTYKDYDILESFKDTTFGFVSENIKDIDDLIEEILKYDVYDFITRLSALNLIIENQNKSIFFDTVIEKLLKKCDSFVERAPKMSSKKFKNIINKIEKSSLSMLIDPPENPFVERIEYYGNHWIFNGINYVPAYSLQAFINIIYLRKYIFSEAFINEANLLISFILKISDRAVEKLKYNLETNKITDAEKVIIPSASEMEILKKCVLLDSKWIKYFLKDATLMDSLLYQPSENTDKKVDINNLTIFSHPFLTIDEDNVLVLNPSILASFLIHRLVLLAKQFNEFELLIKNYNDLIFDYCIEYLRRLGYQTIDEEKYKLNLIKNSYRKEKLLIVEESNILVVNFICDDGKNYDANAMFGNCIILDSLPDLEKRVNYFCSQISNLEKDQIYILNIVNSFGRSVEYKIHNIIKQRSICLSPYELMCVSINEKSHYNFLIKYIDAKSKIKCCEFGILTSELNSIDIYTKQGYSFYLSDDVDMRSLHMFFTLGNSLEYIIKAIITEDKHLELYDCTRCVEVRRFDQIRPIYYPEPILFNEIKMLVKLKNLNIWISSQQPRSEEEIDIYYCLIDLIAYWLAECKGYIDKLIFDIPLININIILSSNIKDYFIKDGKVLVNKQIEYKIQNNTIYMSWSSDAFKSLGDCYNTTEKGIIKSLILEMNKLSITNVDICEVDKIFDNKLKKKAIEIDIKQEPILKPVNHKFVPISVEDIEVLLDEIGNHFLETQEYTIGRVPNKDRTKLSNDVVGYLYDLLKEELSQVSYKGFYEKVYLDLETVLVRTYTNQNRFKYDISCYPEKKDELVKFQNEIDESSVALKFLMEYITAIPPSGEKTIQRRKYERILAICSLIIEWAYYNDLFYYNIFNTPIEFLPSRRIGMRRDEENNLVQLNYFAKMRKMEELSDPTINNFFAQQAANELSLKIDEAFLDEYGYDFTSFIKCINSLISYGENIQDEIKKCKINDAIEYININTEIDVNIISKIISQISLNEREDYLIPPLPYRKEDIYPWRFNRELSFIRRPVIKYKDDIIWGNRNIRQMYKYIYNLMLNGKYKSRKKKLGKLIGKINNIRGQEFNDAVFNKLKKIKDIFVYKEISKINGKRIAGTDKNVLGDIDILCIIPSKMKIVVGEVKDFSFARNPYELEQEYKKIFIDDVKPCFLTKHRRRASWIKENIDDVIAQYELEKSKWTVKTVMFVSDEIISKEFFNVNEKIILYTDITEENILSI